MRINQNQSLFTALYYYFDDSCIKFIEFFDSFGLPPSETIKKFLKTSGKDIVYNDSQLQSNKGYSRGVTSVF